MQNERLHPCMLQTTKVHELAKSRLRLKKQVANCTEQRWAGPENVLPLHMTVKFFWLNDTRARVISMYVDCMCRALLPQQWPPPSLLGNVKPQEMPAPHKEPRRVYVPCNVLQAAAFDLWMHPPCNIWPSLVCDYIIWAYMPDVLYLSIRLTCQQDYVICRCLEF